MIEHRLIERAVVLMGAEEERLESGGKIDPVVIDTLVDFIRTYADRCHHGKEEHKLGRRLTKELVEAKDAVVSGDTGRLTDVISAMDGLIGFYPQHIEKEDKRFFPDTERYYSPDELEAMIQRFYTFYMWMIHEKYGSVVDSLEG